MSSSASKRRKLDVANDSDPGFVEITATDYEEDLDSILARIKQQEESEALARQLQSSDWNNLPNTSAKTSRAAIIDVDKDVIDISDDDASEAEDDAAMAQRLAREWEKEDNKRKVVRPIEAGPSTSRTSTLPRPFKRVDLNLETPPDARLLEHQKLFVQSRNCSKCNKQIESPRGLVMFSASVPPPSLLMLLHAPCRSCQINHCRGCFRVIDCPLKCTGKMSCKVQTCCAEGRAIAIFEALGGLDRKFIEDRNNTQSRINAAAKGKKKNNPGSKSVGPGGTGYGTGSQCSNAISAPSRGKRKLDDSTIMDALASNWDKTLVAGLATLTTLLPDPYAENTCPYDVLPHTSIGHLISLSYLPEILSDLLRNDSVTDWVQRSEAYHATIVLLRRMVDCELTVACLIQPRWEKSKSCGLEEWMWGDGQIIWEKESNSEKGSRIARNPPLYDNFKRLNKQCKAFLTGASQMMEGDSVSEEDIEEIVKATSICGDITAAKDDIERTMVALGCFSDPHSQSDEPPNSRSSSSGVISKGKRRDPDIDMEKMYSTECERLAFQHVDSLADGGRRGFGHDYENFNYAAQLRQTDSCTRNPKDRLHLIKELAGLSTCLPPGVWVRVDEVRHDAIKIMIAGPEDTPYAGGLFEFDCLMPLEYPHKPPLLHLRTTGGGSVRFNPNLYNNGKVCLSLLGTWPGRPEEQWSPSSTLLQVIVSIQSMIFVDLPYFNEPGYGNADPTKPASVAYNRNISLQTVRWGMVEWLKDHHRGGIWEDVIASHFLIRKDKIRKCIEHWAVREPQLRRYTQQPAGYEWQGAAVNHRINGPAGLDLIAEYDRGIARIKMWQGNH